jgi:hypothetical protein
VPCFFRLPEAAPVCPPAKSPGRSLLIGIGMGLERLSGVNGFYVPPAFRSKKAVGRY